jgi:tRNA (adenine37-N6)-methyltransferase
VLREASGEEVDEVEHEAELVCRAVATVVLDEARGVYRLVVLPASRPALRGLGSCTHVIVVWWADRAAAGSDLVVELPYAPGVWTGVFANRSEHRPNPIAITVAPLISVDESAGTVELAWIDAFDGTPVLDIKPYLPMADRVMSAEYPEWLQGFPESMEAATEFFSDPDNLARFS